MTKYIFFSYLKSSIYHWFQWGKSIYIIRSKTINDMFDLIPEEYVTFCLNLISKYMSSCLSMIIIIVDINRTAAPHCGGEGRHDKHILSL